MLALGPQAVGEQREIEHALAVATHGGGLHLLKLIGQHLLGVVEQPPDEGRLAVIHGAGGGDAHEVSPLDALKLGVVRGVACAGGGCGAH